VNRREFLQLLSAGSLAVACGDNLHLGSTTDAVAILEPSTSSFVVAVWSASARSATVDVSAGGDTVGSFSVDLTETGSGMAVVDSLAPDALYDVTVTTDSGVRLGPHQVRTAPSDDATRPIRIAVSADWDPSPEFASDLVDQLIAAGPELYVSIGDNPYTDNGPPAMDVPTYRQRHADLRTDPKARALHEACGWRAIYDDHEFRNDWDAHFVALEGSRYAAAMQVWDEFFPLPGATVKYRNWRWGQNLECILLDCRRYRSADAAPDDASKTMLGATQLQWLLDTLSKSIATFKLVFTSIPLDYGNGDDHWSSFTTERQTIFDHLYNHKISGVLFVSGDQHWFASHAHQYGIREFQIGPVARGLGMPMVQAPGVLYRNVRFNVGLIDIAGDQLTFTGLGAGGDRFHSETLTAEQLTPSAPTAASVR
jgi:hypothetical protein